MSPALAQLRQATRTLHDRTEAVIGADRILSGAITAAEYDGLLRCNYHLYAQVEPKLTKAAAYLAPELLPLLPTLLPALKRAGAQRDIDTEPAAFVDWPTFDPVLSRPALYGTAYVLLGSHLGGKVIHRSLARHSEIAASGGGLDFYAELAATPARHWPRFLTLLAEHIQSPQEIEATSAYAVEMFTFVLEVFQRGKRR